MIVTLILYINFIHNLTGGEYHVGSRIATSTFDIAKLTAAFFLSSQLYGCVNPRAASPTAPSPEDNIIGYLYPEDPVVGHLNLEIRNDFRGGYKEDNITQAYYSVMIVRIII